MFKNQFTPKKMFKKQYNFNPKKKKTSIQKGMEVETQKFAFYDKRNNKMLFLVPTREKHFNKTAI